MNDVMAFLLRRRSIRKYQARPVETEKLRLLLEAAMAAPSASNSQPWEFIVITEPERLQMLRGKLFFGPYAAPAAIVICAHLSIAHNSSARFYWVQDCSAAAENILIAAAGLDLGAVWIGVHPIPSVVKPVASILGLPAEVEPFCVILLGYPDETKPPRTQYDEHRVHWQQYTPRKRRAKNHRAKYLA